MRKYDYDLIVVGGGGAGITAALTAGNLGKKTAIIEKNNLGGECTWTGCIPSKALIKTASYAYNFKYMQKFGLNIQGEFELNYSGAMEYVRKVINSVYKEESPEVFEEKGIKVYKGEARFLNKHTLSVNNEKLTSKNIILATGTIPFIPPINGIEDIDYLTNETIFQLKTLPKSIMILGAGAIGIELAQSLSRLGVKVTVVLRSKRILAKEEEELTGILEESLEKEGIIILRNTKVEKFERKYEKTVVTLKNDKDDMTQMEFEKVLIATGRKPALNGLNLDDVGIKYTNKGIVVNKKLQTSLKHVYACGDIVGPYRFSHMAEYQGIIAALNNILPLKRKVKYKNVLWCTFTDPELAHLGITEKEARELHGDDIKVYKYNYNNLDRAKTDNKEKGLAKVICDKKGNILGSHILGERAGEIIHELQVIKSLNLPISKIQSMIHAYPTYSDIIKKISRDAYISKVQSNSFIKIIKKILKK